MASKPGQIGHESPAAGAANSTIKENCEEVSLSSTTFHSDTWLADKSAAVSAQKYKLGESSKVKTPRKSVSFPKLIENPPEIMSSSGRRPLLDDHESSADEHTGILSSRKDTRRDYSTVDESSSHGNRANEHDRIEGAPVKHRDPNSKAKRGTALKAGKSWLSDTLEKYGSVELENKGSVARDHLALERTFLAWLRTSLSFASIGIAVTQLFRLNTSIGVVDPTHPAINHLRKVGKPLGASFIGIAILILFIGFHRYFESQHYIIRGKFPASRGSVFLVAILAFALTIASLVVVVVVGGAGLKQVKNG